MSNEWNQIWPTEAGDYWMYSYRYGRISCGTPSKPELSVVKVRKVANGVMYSADGQFLFETEPEEAWFKKLDLPDPPKGFKK